MQKIHNVIRYFLCYEQKIAYIIPNKKFFLRNVLPVLDCYREQIKINITQMTVMSKQHGGVIYFKIPVTEQLEETQMTTYYVDETATLSEDCLTLLASRKRSVPK